MSSVSNRTPLVSVADIDAGTLAYLEVVSGKHGQAALDAWLKFTGWRDESNRTEDEKEELNLVHRFRSETNPAKKAKLRALLGGKDPNDPKYSPRYQISVAARLRIAVEHSPIFLTPQMATPGGTRPPTGANFNNDSTRQDKRPWRLYTQ